MSYYTIDTMRIIVFILLSGFLSSCVSSSGSLVYYGEPRKYTIEESKTLLSDTTLFASKIPLVLKDEVFVEINRVYHHDDRILLLDRRANQVVIFDEQGNHVNTIRRVGRGPGEYVELGDFFVDTNNNRIVLYTTIPVALYFFDLDGNFLESRPIDKFIEEITDTDHDFYVALPALSDNGKAAANSIGFLAKDDLKVEEAFPANDRVADLYFGSNFLLHGGSVLFTRMFDYGIYEIGAEREIIPRYTIDFGDHTLPASYKGEKMEPLKFSREIRRDKYVYAIGNVYESDRYVFFKTNGFTGFYILYKDSDKCVYYPAIKDEEYDLATANYIPIEGIPGKVGFILYPELLNSYLEDTSGKVLSRTKKLAEENAKLENPALFIYTLK